MFCTSEPGTYSLGTPSVEGHASCKVSMCARQVSSYLGHPCVLRPRSGLRLGAGDVHDLPDAPAAVPGLMQLDLASDLDADAGLVAQAFGSTS